jgi:hypothetical protein
MLYQKTKGIFIALIIAIICSFALTSQAQDCKFKEDKIDPFTKKRMRSEVFMLTKKAPRWWLTLEQAGDHYFATFTIYQMKDVVEIMKSGTQMLLMLENGKTLELTVDKDILPVRNVEQGTYIVTSWAPRIELTKEQLTLLSSSPLANARTQIGGVDIDCPQIKGKQGEKVMALSACLLQK